LATSNNPAGAVAGDSGVPAASAAPDADALTALLAKSGAENFPVASRVLPKALRRDLFALYGFARLVDDVGDQSPDTVADAAEADRRLRMLDDVATELDLIWTAEPTWPVMRRLAVTVRAHRIPPEPFHALIEANRIDQRVATYQTYAELDDYCSYSANPVGQVVLYIADAATPERIALSDRICTALQLFEHSQDVAEDHRRGRVYLPAEELTKSGLDPADLHGELTARQASAELRAAVRGMVERAEQLLEAGLPLVPTLRGFTRWAVAGYAAGGRATARALRHADYDVLAAVPKPSRWRTLAGTARLAVRRGGSGGGAV
jgi:squalene synthase HpnC